MAWIKTALMALAAHVPATYARTAPIVALLQQTDGERPLTQPTRLRMKKHITATLIAIERMCNGIITSFFVLSRP
jgi:hypothetical protein